MRGDVAALQGSNGRAPSCPHHTHAAMRRRALRPQVLSELGLGGGNPRKSPGDGVAVNEDLLVEVCRAGAGEGGGRGYRDERGRRKGRGGVGWMGVEGACMLLPGGSCIRTYQPVIPCPSCLARELSPSMLAPLPHPPRLPGPTPSFSPPSNPSPLPAPPSP